MKKWLQLVTAPNVSASFSSSLYLSISISLASLAIETSSLTVSVLRLSVLLAAKAVIKFERAVVV